MEVPELVTEHLLLRLTLLPILEPVVSPRATSMKMASPTWWPRIPPAAMCPSCWEMGVVAWAMAPSAPPSITRPRRARAMLSQSISTRTASSIWQPRTLAMRVFQFCWATGRSVLVMAPSAPPPILTHIGSHRRLPLPISMRTESRTSSLRAFRPIPCRFFWAGEALEWVMVRSRPMRTSRLLTDLSQSTVVILMRMGYLTWSPQIQAATTYRSCLATAPAVLGTAHSQPLSTMPPVTALLLR